MPIHVFRAFPMTADVDGTVVDAPHHASRRRRASVASSNLPAALVRVDGHGPHRARHALVLRTPHDVTLAVDGTDTTLPHDDRAHRRASCSRRARSRSVRTTRWTPRSTPASPTA